jgi:hypothetical protein
VLRRPVETAINNEVKTHTAWDLGVSDSTAIWFIQCINRERRLVDYYEASGVGLDPGNTETTTFRTTSSIAN